MPKHPVSKPPPTSRLRPSSAACPDVLRAPVRDPSALLIGPFRISHQTIVVARNPPLDFRSSRRRTAKR